MAALRNSRKMPWLKPRHSTRTILYPCTKNSTRR